MRVTTIGIQTQFLSAIDQLQTSLAQTQNQVSLGESFTTPSQNPVAAGEVANYNQVLAQSQQYDRNSSSAQGNLGLENNALTQVQSSLQSIRDLALEANNATETPANRSAIATQIEQIRDSLLSVANSQNGSGDYLFSGYSAQTQPFVLTSTGATYQGDQGQQQIQIGPATTVAQGDNGSVVFEQIKTGNGVFTATAGTGNTGTGVLGATTVTDPNAYDGGTYTIQFTTAGTYQVLDSNNAVVTTGNFTSGQSISFKGVQVVLTGQPASGDSFTVAPSKNQDLFTTLQSLITTLQSGASSPAAEAQFNSAIGNSIDNIDQALNQTSNVQSEVGSRLNAITAQSALASNQEVQLKTTISQLQDLDYASALTTLNQQVTSLSAAEQSYTLTQGLSLFKYL